MTTPNRSSRTLWAGIFLAVILALALRCPQLDVRPMHNDEAVNAIKLRDLWERGTYRFDPLEYHGPTLLYLELAWVKLIHAADFVQLTESQLRFLPVIFGVGLILLLPLVADGLGIRATICAALFTAISPAMVFYSRYFIHEMLLVFFTFLTLACAWRYWRNQKMMWALLTGAGIGLMQATKETFVFSLTALAAALVINQFFAKGDSALNLAEPIALKIENTPHPVPLPFVGGEERGEGSTQRVPFKLNYAHIAFALLIWLIVVVVLFSSFFTNANGPLDSLRTYSTWLHRAGGASPHIHPWNFYLERLAWFHQGRGAIWSEGLILGFGLLGIIAVFMRVGLKKSNLAFVRVLALYTIILTVIYSGISYKTPWCLLNFWNGWILLAGVGVVALMNNLRRRAVRVLAGVLLIADGTQLATQAWRLATTDSADPRNPYVYAQTSPDILELVERVKTAGETDPQHNQMLIEVVAPDSDYWPLPWYLRQFKKVGWWDAVPKNVPASLMIVSAKIPQDLETGKPYVSDGLYELRPQTFLELFMTADLWREYLAKRAAQDESSK